MNETFEIPNAKVLEKKLKLIRDNKSLKDTNFELKRIIDKIVINTEKGKSCSSFGLDELTPGIIAILQKNNYTILKVKRSVPIHNRPHFVKTHIFYQVYIIHIDPNLLKNGDIILPLVYIE